MPKKRDPFETPKFVKALSHVYEVEGGFVNNPKDPGGKTNFGISGKHNVGVKVEQLNQKNANKIYENRYWNKIRGEELPPKEAVALFDNAVLSGPQTAIKNAQEILGLPNKGHMDDRTIQKLRDYVASEGSDSFLSILDRKRRDRLSRLKAYKHFGKGWEARLDKLNKNLRE